MREYKDGIGDSNTVIVTTTGIYLKSYESIVAVEIFDGRRQVLSNLWNYSRSTSRHVNKFFGESVRNNLEHYTVLPGPDLTIEGQ